MPSASASQGFEAVVVVFMLVAIATFQAAPLGSFAIERLSFIALSVEQKTQSELLRAECVTVRVNPTSWGSKAMLSRTR